MNYNLKINYSHEELDEKSTQMLLLKRRQKVGKNMVTDTNSPTIFQRFTILFTSLELTKDTLCYQNTIICTGISLQKTQYHASTVELIHVVLHQNSYYYQSNI